MAQESRTAYDQGDFHKAFAIAQPRANAGHVDDQAVMCELYYNGNYVQKNVSKALHWCGLAADQENARAQAILGFIYLKGEKVKQNYTKAFQYLRSAAEHEMPATQFVLATLYATGRGTTRSVNKAAEWFYKAGHGALKIGARDNALTALDALQKVAPDHLLTQRLASEIYSPPREPEAPPSEGNNATPSLPTCVRHLPTRQLL